MSVSEDLGPFVRVEDASMVADGGTARLVLSRLPQAEDVASALARSGASVDLDDGRLRTVSTPSRVSDAAGRAAGPELAATVAAAIDRAVKGWTGPAADVETPAGTLPCSKRPVIMGVVNVTPDSFSDGGAHYDPDDPGAAIEWGERLLAAGADLLDVGGESTRPGAESVTEEEELRRVVPVVEALAGAGAVVSVDTSKSAVVRAAVEAGAALVNDVSAGALDGLLLPTVAELEVPYVVMHMRGTPRTMQRDPKYSDVVAEVYDFLAETLARIELVGVAAERTIVDPGIGFGKTVDHNLELLNRIRELTSLRRPVLVGTSRKSFLGRITGRDEASDRVVGSVTSAALAVADGVSIVRVHDVGETLEALQVAHAVRSGRVEDVWTG